MFELWAVIHPQCEARMKNIRDGDERKSWVSIFDVTKTWSADIIDSCFLITIYFGLYIDGTTTSSF